MKGWISEEEKLCSHAGTPPPPSLVSPSSDKHTLQREEGRREEEREGGRKEEKRRGREEEKKSGS